MKSEEKTKVLYVITKSNFGGAQRYVYDLATSIPTDRFDVAVALGGTGARDEVAGKLDVLLKKAGVRTMFVESFMRDMSFINDIRAFCELYRIVRKERPHVLHVSSSKAGGLGVVVGRLLRVPSVVFTSHGLTHDEMWRPYWQRVLILFFTWLTALLSTKTILVSRDNYDRVRRMPCIRKKAVLIHNGIAAPLLIDRNEARETLAPHVGEAEVCVGSIAEYHPNKNLETLIQALKLVHMDGHKVHLILIGEGDERQALREAAMLSGVDEYVHLIGFVEDAPRYLQALDMFILPSKKEGLPYVLLEAGYASLPTIASNLPGNKDIIEHECSGLLVPPSKAGLAQAILQLLDDPEKMQRYGSALHQHVTTEFSVSHMTAQTVAVYSASVSPSTSRSSFSRRTERS